MKHFRQITRQTLFGITLLFAGCDLVAVGAEPMGKTLERALKEIEHDCRRREAPPFGPGSREYKDTSCLMFTLKPWEPGDTPESAFAHSIKLPPPHDKPKDVYKSGMSSEEYFQALCQVEAGEWVFRRVEGVEGIRQERPESKIRLDYSVAFHMKEPSVVPIVNPKSIFGNPPASRYAYFERRLTQAEREKQAMTHEYFDSSTTKLISQPKSNFAYLSRGIRRMQDRQHAIEGIEYIIYQIEPFEVLGLQRYFTQYYYDKTTKDKRTPWTRSCVIKMRYPSDFLRFVLIPSQK